MVALVAAKDAAATVGPTVAALRGLAEVDDVLVVDDGSTDGTAEAARDAGAWVLQLDRNRGKGGAVAAGVQATPETDVYVLVDADVGATAAAIGDLMPPVVAGTADMAVGVLPSAGGKGGLGLVRALAAAGIRRATGGFVAQAPLSGQRVVRGPLLRSLALASRFGLETALTIDVVRAGATVVEIPVDMDHRHTGRGLPGFVHRARQGADVVRALWPRLTSSGGRMAVIAAALIVAVAASLWSGAAGHSSSVALPRPAAKVLLVGIPGLSWNDVGSGAMPVLDGMVEQGAVAAMTVRTRSPEPVVTEGYATLGAGSRVAASDRQGVATDRDGRVVVGPAEALRDGAGRWSPTEPGALGDALHAAGLRTAVVGNADLPPGSSSGLGPGAGPEAPAGGRPAVLTPAAVALMDRGGVVDAGTVAHDLLSGSRGAPFGVRAQPDRVVAATRAALARADVVLVDDGDLSRVEALQTVAPAELVARSRALAVAGTDALLGRLTADLPPDTLVLVVSVVPPDDEWRLTPVVASGAGVRSGSLYSPSTRRPGLVALTDVAPTVLDALGAPVPTAMVGNPLRYAPGDADLGALARLDRDAAARQRMHLPIAVGFIVVQALVYLLVLAAVARSRSGPAWGRPGLRLALLAVAAFPLATFVFRALPFDAGLGPAGVSLIAAVDASVVAVAVRARRSPLAPLAWILGATAVVLLVDVATGSRLQPASILGYSPSTAGRFQGLGNTAFAVLGTTALLAGVLHLVHAPRRREALATVAAGWALVVVLDGAPTLGNDVGGILSLVPVLVLTFAVLAGRRLTGRLVLATAVTVIVLLATATAVDLLRPPEARSHLGRFAANVADHGMEPLLTTIARRASVNLDAATASAWAWAVPVIAAVLLSLAVGRPRGTPLLPPGSPVRTGVVAALALGVVGSLANDSGVVVLAVALLYVAPVLALTALAADGGRGVLREPTSPAPGPSLAAGRAKTG